MPAMVFRTEFFTMYSLCKLSRLRPMEAGVNALPDPADSPTTSTDVHGEASTDAPLPSALFSWISH